MALKQPADLQAILAQAFAFSPTEAEWEKAARGSSETRKHYFPYKEHLRFGFRCARPPNLKDLSSSDQPLLHFLAIRHIRIYAPIKIDSSIKGTIKEIGCRLD